MDSATLQVLARALDGELKGRYVAADVLLPLPQKAILRLQSAQAQTDVELRERDLHILLDSSSPFVWLEGARPHANPDPLAETLSAWIVGRRLEGIESDPRDRTVTLHMSPSPSGGDRPGEVRVLLYGTKPRLLFLEEGQLLHKYPGGKVDLAEGTGARDRPWIFDPSIMTEAPRALRNLLNGPAPSAPSECDALTRRLVKSLRGCDMTLAQEILWRSRADDANLADGLDSLRHEFELLDERSGLHLYLWQDTGSRLTHGRLCALRLTHLDEKEGLRHTKGDLLRQGARWGQVVQKQRALALLQRRRRDLVRPLQRWMTRLAKRLVDEKKRGESAKLWRLWGEALLVHAGRIARGNRSVRVSNPHDPSQTLEIRLDPRLTAPENAGSYFRKARREEKAQPLREQRLQVAETMVAHLAQSEMLESARAWRQWLERGVQILTPFGEREAGASAEQKEIPHTKDLLLKWRTLRKKLLILLETPKAVNPLEDVHDRLIPSSERGRLSDAAAGEFPPRGAIRRRPSRQKREGPGFHPRQFVTSDGWKVFVGRTNQENDYVTHVFARPDDLWFHVHGAAGSHVVLRREGRKDNPSTRALEEVASIAARFSQARHSKKVPVIYTQKKYVRKPRKAAPGLALCTREKTIMVEPADDEMLKALQPRQLAEPDDS